MKELSLLRTARTARKTKAPSKTELKAARRAKRRAREARRLQPLLDLRFPRGSGVAASFILIFGFATYGVVKGDHIPAVLGQLKDVRDAAANAVGFRIASIALAGQKYVSREEILGIAGVTGRTSLLFFDADQARTNLKTNPWIADATVLKLYPDRLHIAVTEREAFALWQKEGRVSVIASDGTMV